MDCFIICSMGRSEKRSTNRRRASHYIFSKHNALAFFVKKLRHSGSIVMFRQCQKLVSNVIIIFFANTKKNDHLNWASSLCNVVMFHSQYTCYHSSGLKVIYYTHTKMLNKNFNIVHRSQCDWKHWLVVSKTKSVHFCNYIRVSWWD